MCLIRIIQGAVIVCAITITVLAGNLTDDMLSASVIVISMWSMVFLICVLPYIIRYRSRKKQEQQFLNALEDKIVSAQIKAEHILQEKQNNQNIPDAQDGAWLHCKNCNDAGFCTTWGMPCAEIDCNIKQSVK